MQSLVYKMDMLEAFVINQVVGQCSCSFRKIIKFICINKIWIYAIGSFVPVAIFQSKNLNIEHYGQIGQPNVFISSMLKGIVPICCKEETGSRTLESFQARDNPG